MAETVHVNGECHIRVGTASSSVLESLGYTVDGVGIRFVQHTADVKADTGGGDEGVPVDVQDMGQEAFITAQLVVYDDAVLAKIRMRPATNNTYADTTSGTLPTIGNLIFANALYHRLTLTSPSESLPWNFPTAYLHDAKEVKIGTKRTTWSLTWRAIAYFGVGAAAGTALYNRTTSG